MNQQMSPEMQQCIEACMACHSMCEETIAHCLKMGGQHADGARIRMLMDCADMCRMAADMMLRGSDMHMKMCEMCADACMRCAEACRDMPNDTQLMACAEMCMRCSEMCRSMASMAM